MDKIADWLSIALDWINPAAAAFVDIAHTISYAWRAKLEYDKGRNWRGDRLIAAAIITGGFAAVSGPLQAYSTQIKQFFQNGGTISSGAAALSRFILTNLNTILKAITQAISLLNSSQWAKDFAYNIGVTREFIVSVPKMLEDKSVSMLNQLELSNKS
jgi:hypothetical protein